MSNGRDTGTHGAPIHNYYYQPPSRDMEIGTRRSIHGGGSTLKDLQQYKHTNARSVTKCHELAMPSKPVLHDAYQQALQWAQSLPEVWKRPCSSDAIRFFPFTNKLKIRLWDSNVSRRPDSSMRVFGLDFVDTHGKPQYVGPRVVVIAGRKVPFDGPEVEGDALVPIDGVGESKATVPERYGVVADCEYLFLIDGKVAVAYTFAQNSLDS